MIDQVLSLWGKEMRKRCRLHLFNWDLHDAFNRTWWSVLSIDMLVTWQHFINRKNWPPRRVEDVVLLKVLKIMLGAWKTNKALIQKARVLSSCISIKAMTSCSTHKIDQQEKDD